MVTFIWYSKRINIILQNNMKQAMNTSTLHQLFLTGAGITTDSRDCPPGSMFFALKCDTFNGNPLR